MQASQHDIEILRKLQEVDRSVALAQKDFDSLPHRKAILEVRRKSEEVLKNKVRVQDMQDTAEEKFESLVKEDERLLKKAEEIEALLQEAKGDFRSVESRSKELNGVHKRRKDLAKELEKVNGQLEKIAPVMKQVMKAVQDLTRNEQDLVASFQKEGGALKKQLFEGRQLHDKLVAQLNPALAKAYRETQARCGDIVLSELTGSSCGACRHSFEQGRLSIIRSQAPLATCPFCGRLLIIE